MRTGVSLLVVVCVLAAAVPTFAQEPEVKFSWNWLNFTFQTNDEYQHYYNNGYYASCLLAGVKVSMDGDYYVSVPRWKNGVPSTLNKVVETSDGYLLQPYPSWDMNALGNVTAFQSVLGFEIDADNNMWVLDQGKVAGQPALPGTIKLVVINLNTSREVFRYYFDEETAPLDSSFINDIVVDLRGGFAYISDTGLTVNDTTTVNGAIIVFDIENQMARRVLQQDMSVQNSGLYLRINDIDVLPSYRLVAGADGIALTPDGETLFWCALIGHELYSIPTYYLQNFTNSNDLLSEMVVDNGGKGSASDGMSFSNTSTLWATSLEYSAMHYNEFLGAETQRRGARDMPEDSTTQTGPSFSTNGEFMSQCNNSDTMWWPDTVAWDHEGSVVFTSNHLNAFYTNSINFLTPASPNFHIWSVYVMQDSYLANNYPPEDSIMRKYAN